MSTTSTVPMTSTEGARFDVATGALWLDFVYTGGAGERARWESLHAPADLERWLRASRVATIARMPAVELTDADLVQARALREVLWRCANDLADGRGVRTGDAAALNGWAGAPDLAPALVDGRAGWVGPVTGPQVLSTLARDAIATVTGLAQPARLRRCAAEDCALLFVDTSRPGQRRWCAMTRCGNRTKARTRRGTRRARRDTAQEGTP